MSIDPKLAKNALARALVWRFVILHFFLVALMSVGALLQDYWQIVDETEAEIHQIEKFSVPTLGDDLFAGHHVRLAAQLKGIVQSSNIVVAELRVEGSTLLKAGADYKGEVSTRLLPIWYEESGKKEKLGDLVVGIGKNHVSEKVFSHLAFFILATIGIAAIISLSSFLIFSRLVGRHLARISTHLMDKDNVRDGSTLKLDRIEPSGGDELSLLVLRINEMEMRSQNVQRALQEQVENLTILQTAIETSISAFAFADLQGRLTMVNPALLKMWSLDRLQDALGKSVLDFWVDPNDAQAVIDAIAVAGKWQGKMHAKTHMGTRFHVMVSAQLLTGNDGSPICMLASFVDVTELMREMEERERLNTLLSALIACVPTLLFVKTAGDLKYELLSHEGEKLLGMSKADWYGKTDFDLFPTDQADGFQAADRQAFDSHAFLEIPQEGVTTFNGDTRLLHTRKIGIRNSQGEATHLLGVSLDITDQLKLQKKLEQERNFSTSLIEMAPVIVLMLDLQGDIYFVNPYFERLTGFKLDDVKGKSWFDTFIPVRERERIQKVFQSSVNETPTRGNINPILDRNGNEIQIQWYGQNMQSAADRTTYVLAIGMDVTERTRLELENDVTSRQLLQANRLAKLGHWQLTIATGSLRWSEEIYRIFEIDPSEFTATYEAFLNAIHPDDRDAVNNAYVESLATLQPYSIVHRLRMSDGRIKWIQENCTTEFDTEGNPVTSIGTVQDVTEIKRAEDALHHLNMELEQKVTLRTSEFQVAKLEAEKASLAKSDFLSHMSHELRTPLNSVIGFAQLLEADQTLTETQLDSVREILDSGQHLLALVKQVLDVSAIEKRSLTINFEEVGITQVIDQCVRQILPLAKQRGISVKTMFDCNAVVEADKMRLTEVLLNLLSNAVKYNRTGGDIEVHCSAVEGQRIRVSVHDSGYGIPGEDISRLFTPFERLQPDDSYIEGTGLGLALSKRLVEAMHGEIGVESVLGQGSVFWFSLRQVSAEQ